jgi:Domain of unknown function (DUF5658)
MGRLFVAIAIIGTQLADALTMLFGLGFHGAHEANPIARFEAGLPVGYILAKLITGLIVTGIVFWFYREGEHRIAALAVVLTVAIGVLCVYSNVIVIAQVI